MRKPLIISLTLVLAPFAAQAQIYSWKDADGKTHYGDRPPSSAPSASRRLQAAPAASPDVPAKEAGKPAATNSKPQAPAETPEQARQRDENCRRAQQNLAAIESGQVRFTFDASGERVALDDQVREAELARARKSVEGWCKPPAR